MDLSEDGSSIPIVVGSVELTNDQNDHAVVIYGNCPRDERSDVHPYD